jgi:hypothetical protein
MNRNIGIIIAAAGFVLAIVSVVGVLPGLTGTGITLLLTGGLVIGLSFIDPIEREEKDAIPTLRSLVMIFHSPVEVFRSFRRAPQWLAAFLFITVISTAYGQLFVARLSPERITNFTIDKTLEMPLLDDESRRTIELGRSEALAQAKDPVIRIGQAISGAASSFIGYVFLAALFVGIATAFGGQLKFLQSLSITIYAALPVSVIRYVLSTFLLFLKDPDEIHPILGQQALLQDNLGILVQPADSPVLYTLLASISLLGLYWIFLNSIGLKNGGENVTFTMAWAATIIIYVVTVLFAVSMAALFPGFIS